MMTLGSKNMADGLPKGTITYNGHGQADNWSDAANWAGGVAPSGVSSIALMPVNATLNGTFTVGSLMVLGQETVTVNGTLNTLSPGFCSSFMVCNGALVNFASSSALNTAGGFIVGINEAGAVVAHGAGSAHAMLNTLNGKMGENPGSLGSITIDDAIWHDRGQMFVGVAGHGSLTVTNGGQISTGDAFIIGDDSTGVGVVSLSGGSNVTVGAFAAVGGSGEGQNPKLPPGGGSGTLSVASGSVFSAAYRIDVHAGSTITLAGGTVAVTDAYPGLQISAGGTLSGNGTVTIGGVSPSQFGVTDNGMIQASGGVLQINGALLGTGQVQIGASSTLSINGPSIGVGTIAFTGSNGTLALSKGIADHAVLTGFAVGDTIFMAGVDNLSFNASTDVLTLSAGTHVVDNLQLAGSYASNAFTLTHSGIGATIGLLPGAHF